MEGVTGEMKGSEDIRDDVFTRNGPYLPCAHYGRALITPVRHQPPVISKV